ncbi:MAG: Tim44 domain-containing protein [Nitrosomonadales bacterium]|nr:Tim44 domain-containing protein [Nitrosomonadales bacterium]
MKRFLMLLTIALTSLSLFAATAEAKRFGGGGSFGKQRTMAPQQAQKAPAAAPATTPGAAPASTGNKWLGPLAGLAIGAGLGALFMGGGLGGAMSGILMAVLAGVAVMFLISMFRKKQPQAAMQYAGAGAPYSAPQPVQQPLAGGSAAPVAAVAAANIPADFPAESFLRSAKTTFIRLQAANDRKDLNDIREYTTPEMFAEISMQIGERDNAPQQTDVVSIHAELLEVANEGDYAIASVRFTGQLSENKGAPESVDEIWHVHKNLKDDKAVWLLAGIQQTTLH